jgi:hypothetical protein
LDGLALNPVPLDIPTAPVLYDTLSPSVPLETDLGFDQLWMYHGALPFLDDGDGSASGVPSPTDTLLNADTGPFLDLIA